MSEINIFQKAIEQLIMEGYTILQIVIPNGDILYFNVYKWQEGYFNTAQSIDFNTVEGVNITEFITKNASQCINRTNFISLFNKVMEEGIVVRCEFTKDSTWYKWSSAGVNKKY
jgi:hypothetical protein